MNILNKALSVPIYRCSRDRLKPNEVLYPREQIKSLNGVYSAVLQSDGNFAVYEHGFK